RPLCSGSTTFCSQDNDERRSNSQGSDSYRSRQQKRLTKRNGKEGGKKTQAVEDTSHHQGIADLLPVTRAKLEDTHNGISQGCSSRLPIEKEICYLKAKKMVKLWIEQRSEAKCGCQDGCDHNE